MSRLKDTIIEVQDEIEQGELTFSEIAARYGLSVREVSELASAMTEFNGVDYESA